MMSRTTITVSTELKRRLSILKGRKTWEEFLSELLEASLNSKIEELESFLRETAEERDLPFEKIKLGLREEHGTGDG
ncbi:MAG: hypothetical protein DRN78_03125 [Thermoproteota archaeon]|nr:MAG: hypothetical protein DRN78_03125 [Candidatus Korarchaeota archaeon]